MSKFHVGDRVRIGPEAGGYWKGRVGEVVRMYTLGATPYYVVSLETYKDDVAFVEYELRPADIFAWWKERDSDDD